jgi:hypothetical protein
MGCGISAFNYYENKYHYEYKLKHKFIIHNKLYQHSENETEFEKLSYISKKYICLSEKYNRGTDLNYFCYIDVLNYVINIYINLYYDKLLSTIQLHEDRFRLKAARIEKYLDIMKIRRSTVISYQP